MDRRQFARLVATASVVLGGGGASLESQEQDAMRQYVDRVRADLARLRAEPLAAIEAAGQQLAARVAAGGRLLIYDRRGPYVSEALGRAGGLMAIHPLSASDAGALAASDALLLIADRPADAADVAVAGAAVASGALVVGICPVRDDPDALSQACDLALDNHVTDADAVVTIEGMPGPIAPTSGVLNTALVWAVTAAYIGAMEQLGKPPHVWMSIKRPGAQEFNAAALDATKEAGY